MPSKNHKPDLAEVKSIESARFAPPSDLSEAEARIWRRVHSSMPDGWFRAEHVDLLKDYARHVARVDQLNKAAAELDLIKAASGSLEGPDLKHVNRVYAMAERESRMVLALARSLRITHQAQVDPKTAGRKKKRSAPAIDWTKFENSEANGDG